MAVPKRSCDDDTPPPSRGAARHGDRVALDDEVELVRRAAQQQVAHGAADHVHGVLAVEGGDGGRATEAGQQIHGRHLGVWLTSMGCRRSVHAGTGGGSSSSSERVLAVLVCAAAVFALTRPGDVFNADVEFFEEPSPDLRAHAGGR